MLSDVFETGFAEAYWSSHFPADHGQTMRWMDLKRYAENVLESTVGLGEEQGSLREVKLTRAESNLGVWVSVFVGKTSRSSSLLDLSIAVVAASHLMTLDLSKGSPFYYSVASAFRWDPVVGENQQNLSMYPESEDR